MSDEIPVVSAIEAVRKRPGMYVGDVHDGSGFHHLLDAVVNNALTEGWAGYCDSVQIELKADGFAAVRDNGRGIPTHPRRGEPAPIVIMTQLHCGHGSEKPEQLRDVGLAAVNALSEILELRIWREREEHYVRFRRGVAEGPATVLGKTCQRGTEVTFRPDPEIFGSLQFDFERVQERIRSLAHLDLGVSVSIRDHRPAPPRVVELVV